MSGFLPDLASWALRGGAGNAGNTENSNDAENSADPGPALSEADVRARRLARMEAAMSQQAQQQPEPMDVDKVEKRTKLDEGSEKTTPMDTSSSSPARMNVAPKKVSPKQPEPSQQQKKVKESHSPPPDTTIKAQKKKEMLLKKVLGVSIAGSSTSADSSCVVLDLDSQEIGLHTIAELLAIRLSLAPGSSSLQTTPLQKPLIPYLAYSHRRAGEELKTLQQSNKKDTSELEALLQEIQKQVVSYAASSLIEPDLFELAKDGTTQLAKALLNNTEPAASITFGVAGTSTSFWYCLCDELFNQDKTAFDKVISETITVAMARLSKIETVDGGVGDSSALGLVSALSSMCIHKKAAQAVTEVDQFLLPPAGSPQAEEMIRPPLPAGADLLRMLAGENRP